MLIVFDSPLNFIINLLKYSKENYMFLSVICHVHVYLGCRDLLVFFVEVNLRD